MTSKNSIVLTIHNKENTVENILTGLVSSLSPDTFEIIIILDGCTDRTKNIIERFVSQASKRFLFTILITDDVWETKANNAGLKVVKTLFATIIQDDMLFRERYWDRKLLNVFDMQDIFAVSGRSALDFSLADQKFTPVNVIGREYPFGSKTFLARVVGKLMAIFKPYWIYKFIAPVGYRMTVNRGPLVLQMSSIKALNYFDEEFSPFELDDVDLCCRAFKMFGLYSASCPVYYAEIGGSKASNPHSSEVSKRSIDKNTEILIKRYSDLSLNL